jgi:hypothetical protein
MEAIAQVALKQVESAIGCLVFFFPHFVHRRTGRIKLAPAAFQCGLATRTPAA